LELCWFVIPTRTHTTKQKQQRFENIFVLSHLITKLHSLAHQQLVVFANSYHPHSMNLFISISVLFIFCLLVMMHSWLYWHMSEVHSSHQNAILQLNSSLSEIYLRADLTKKQAAEHIMQNVILKTEINKNTPQPFHSKPIDIPRTDEIARNIHSRKTAKRAILFTMDSISTCKNSI
jgi:hypothetical protein